jgi:hypothetical protein
MCAHCSHDVPFGSGQGLGRVALTLSIWCICSIWCSSEMVVEIRTGDKDRRQEARVGCVLESEEDVRKGGDTRRATARVTHALLASSPLTPLCALPGLSPPAYLPFVVLTGCVSSHPAQHVPRARKQERTACAREKRASSSER